LVDNKQQSKERFVNSLHLSKKQRDRKERDGDRHRHRDKGRDREESWYKEKREREVPRREKSPPRIAEIVAEQTVEEEEEEMIQMEEAVNEGRLLFCISSLNIEATEKAKQNEEAKLKAREKIELGIVCKCNSVFFLISK
jgi:hypothetical protein